jgi:transcriptional regulator with XRE-family HTH domain
MIACQSIFDVFVGIGRIWLLSGMISPEQCRAARALLDWSQGELADKAGVGIVTVRQLEAAAHEPRRATFDVIRRALEGAGIEFIDENGGGPGVRLRKRQKKKD